MISSHTALLNTRGGHLFVSCIGSSVFSGKQSREPYFSWILASSSMSSWFVWLPRWQKCLSLSKEGRSRR